MSTNEDTILPGSYNNVGTPEEHTLKDIIREIFAAVLGRNNFSDEDEFFDMGGTSLGLIAVVARVCGRLKIDVESDIASRGASVSALSRTVSAVLEKNRRRNSQHEVG